MKTKKQNLVSRVLGLLFILMLFASYSCDRSSDDNTIYPDAVIIKELPKMPIGNHRESVIIQSQSELETVFDTATLEQIEDLQGIDFSKYTLLLGYGTYKNQAVQMEHYYSKIGSNTYAYLLKVGSDAPALDFFRYGILVPKLPTSANVNFEIGELNI
ncbi:MAG: hypothetical protein Q4G16_02735 [Cruoricaptor ignavus]|nr:hypothetical protein [Cruoricaptor ignavus]